MSGNEQQIQATAPNVQEAKPAEKSNDKEYNFGQLRKILEQERAEKQEWQRRAEEAERQKSRGREEDDDSSDEPYVDEKRLQKKLDKFEERFDRKVDEKAEAKARMLLEQEKQNQFLRSNPDFHDILREDLIQKFAEKHPEIAEPLVEMPNSFAKQKLLFQNIKALGIHKPPEQKPIQETVDRNRRSPYYQPTGVGSAPYAGQGDFSPNGQKAAYDKLKELKARMRI